MTDLEQLTLNGAMTLLSYLQCAQTIHNRVKAEAIAAVLCEILSQLETNFPGIAQEYGWEKVTLLSNECSSTNQTYLESDRTLSSNFF